MSKRLYRSVEDSKLGGVCGGLGEYFNIDPTFIRILAVLLVFADGVGILAYIIAWIIMPKKPLELTDGQPKEKPATDSNWNRHMPGMILIAVGLLLLIKNYCWWFDFGDIFWPMLLIIAGLIVIFSAGGKKEITNQTANGVEEIK
jgi:phage shock protein C